MNREEVTDIVTQIVTKILKCEASSEITRETCSEWDSLNHVEIIFSLEERFDFQFFRADVDNLSSIPSLVDGILAFSASEEAR